VKEQRTKTRNAVFLGVDAADTREGALAFLKRYRWTWPSIVDPNRQQARRFGVDYQPAFIVIDALGRFVGGFAGRGTPARWSALAAKLP
jgi:hypothetical protein